MWLGASPSGAVMAGSMAAGLLSTGVVRGKAEGWQEAGGTEAVEAVVAVHAGALPAWAGRTLVDLHVA